MTHVGSEFQGLFSFPFFSSFDPWTGQLLKPRSRGVQKNSERPKKRGLCEPEGMKRNSWGIFLPVWPQGQTQVKAPNKTLSDTCTVAQASKALGELGTKKRSPYSQKSMKGIMLFFFLSFLLLLSHWGQSQSQKVYDSTRGLKNGWGVGEMWLKLQEIPSFLARTLVKRVPGN